MESTNLIKSLARLLLAAAMSVLLAQCADDQEKQIEEAVENAEDAKEELDQATQQSDDEEYEQQQQQSDDEDNAAVQQEEENVEASADVLGDMQNSDSLDDDMGMADDTAPVEPETDPLAGGDAAPVEQAVAEAPQQAAPADTGFKTYFVKSSVATAYSDSQGSQAAGSYSKGETLLASAGGSWAQLQDGRYIKMSDLTTKPMGRMKARGTWK